MGCYILIVTGNVFSFVYFLNASWNNFYKFKSANYQIAQCSFSASSAVCWIISEILAAKLKINTKYILYFTPSRPAFWSHCKHLYITSNINRDQYKHKYSIFLTLDKVSGNPLPGCCLVDIYTSVNDCDCFICWLWRQSTKVPFYVILNNCHRLPPPPPPAQSIQKTSSHHQEPTCCIVVG